MKIESMSCITVNMETLLDILWDGIHDTWLMIPLLYASYFLIEYLERKDSQDDSLFWNLQKFGPAFGALLGLLPQCGFAILAAMLFLQRNITMGTMVAVFIATSDEAIPVMISEPQLIPSLLVLLVIKLVVAMAAGYFTDKVLFPRQKITYFQDLPDESEQEEMEEDAQDAADCPCCYRQYPIWLSCLIRTAKVYGFVLLCTWILNGLVVWIGEERLSLFLLDGSWMQTVLAAVFGFIPNCAATVILCQLYAQGQLAFGSLLAGLITNAGMGLVVLFQYEPSKKKVWQVILILLVTALLAGYALSFLQLL